MIMSKTINVGILLLALSGLLGLATIFDYCDECSAQPKEHYALNGGLFVLGVSLVVYGKREHDTKVFFDGIDDIKDKILEDIEHTINIDKIINDVKKILKKYEP